MRNPFTSEQANFEEVDFENISAIHNAILSHCVGIFSEMLQSANCSKEETERSIDYFTFCINNKWQEGILHNLKNIFPKLSPAEKGQFEIELVALLTSPENIEHLKMTVKAMSVKYEDHRRKHEYITRILANFIYPQVTQKLYIAIAEKRDEIIEQNEGAAAIVNTISGAVTETSTVNQA